MVKVAGKEIPEVFWCALFLFECWFLASVSILKSINKELISCKRMIIISSDIILESIMKLDFHSQYKLNKQQLVFEVVPNFSLVQKSKSIKIIRKKGLGNKHQYYPSELIKNKHWILLRLIITTQNGRSCDSSGKVQQTAWGDDVYACSALQHPLLPRHLSGLCRSRLDLNPEWRVLVQVQLLPGQDLPKIEVHRVKWR